MLTQNISCTFTSNSQNISTNVLYLNRLLKTSFIFLLMVITIATNILLIFIINSNRYSRHSHVQPRYLLASLASNDLAMAIMVIPFAIIPALRLCWPYGDLFCKIQALMNGALNQQSAMIIICMAIDRYVYIIHPNKYHKLSVQKGCFIIISISWITSLILYAFLVLSGDNYVFNSRGLFACEPLYNNPSLQIMAACGFYFPTTMIVMYCYGSIFHNSKFHSNANYVHPQLPIKCPHYNLFLAKKFLQYKDECLHASIAKSMALVSFIFIVLVTPWTIYQVVHACTGIRLSRNIDFTLTWLALSNGFWKPFIYALHNAPFRREIKKILHINFEPAEVIQNQNVVTNRCHPEQMRNEVDHLCEKYWSDILDTNLPHT